MKQQIHTNKAPKPLGPYSQGLRIGNRIYLAGQGPIDSATGQIVGNTIEDQTKTTLENIQAILADAGATLRDVVKTTVHLADLKDFAAFNQVYIEYFQEPYPVRTTIGSQLLATMLVEVEVIAENQ
ncbi:Rid family detoxifying hydrolase [Aneurinibacillus sp. Ricciae_BoGa-3]|uniref:RidA family protein n=1 Tax=Aneurinibacillus sp. Ricciae_BoGa-3 TaxID=3022697 RepID=UPI0023426F00|nr:Rid family detoxifying hydrolase [Aneurinibacillus sp. Ricciae_BoGa-3]WCK52351.1 Rid family detoxifying hydrolase [Aneurinibacillus sp. Ricciae_BoGa-3]